MVNALAAVVASNAVGIRVLETAEIRSRGFGRVNWPLCDYSHAFAYLTEGFERLVQLSLSVGGVDDRPDSRFILGYGGECDTRCQDAFLKQLSREPMRSGRLSCYDRRYRGLTDAGVETGVHEPLLEVAGVGPEPLDALRFAFENIERGETRGCYRRRMRGGEKKRARAVVEEFDEVLRSADVAAENANRLRQRADLNIDASVQIEMVDGAAAVAAQYAGGMGVVNHHDGAVLLGMLDQLRQRTDVAIHGEDAVGDQKLVAGRGGEVGENAAGGFVIFVREDVDFGAGETGTVDDACVIELVGDDVILRTEHGGDGPRVGGEAGLEDDAGFDVLESGDAALQFHVEVHGAGDGADGAGARAVFSCGFDGGFDEFGVGGESEIVVGGEVDDFFAVEAGFGGAGAFEDAEALVGAGAFPVFELLAEVGKGVGAGGCHSLQDTAGEVGAAD